MCVDRLNLFGEIWQAERKGETNFTRNDDDITLCGGPVIGEELRTKRSALGTRRECPIKLIQCAQPVGTRSARGGGVPGRC